MLAHTDEPTQLPADAAGPEAAPWPPGVPCPLCARAGTPYDARVSAVLDWVALLEDTVHDVKKAVEALVA